MTENLTESMRLWPWAPWLLLAGLCFAATLFRRDHWGEVPLVGCLVAASVGALAPGAVGLQYLAFAVGCGLALVLVRPWSLDGETHADTPRH